LFRLPIWTGTTSGEDNDNNGGVIIHDARYWVPLIAAYHGARREEFAASSSMTSPNSQGIWGIKFTPTDVRGLKTPASKRRVPLHPELIRLGFLDYVQAVRRAKHTDQKE
jgi:hypothetical protein